MIIIDESFEIKTKEKLTVDVFDNINHSLGYDDFAFVLQESRYHFDQLSNMDFVYCLGRHIEGEITLNFVIVFANTFPLYIHLWKDNFYDENLHLLIPEVVNYVRMLNDINYIEQAVFFNKPFVLVNDIIECCSDYYGIKGSLFSTKPLYKYSFTPIISKDHIGHFIRTIEGVHPLVKAAIVDNFFTNSHKAIVDLLIFINSNDCNLQVAKHNINPLSLKHVPYCSYIQNSREYDAILSLLDIPCNWEVSYTNMNSLIEITSSIFRFETNSNQFDYIKTKLNDFHKLMFRADRGIVKITKTYFWITIEYGMGEIRKFNILTLLLLTPQISM